MRDPLSWLGESSEHDGNVREEQEQSETDSFNEMIAQRDRITETMERLAALEQLEISKAQSL
jgi:hypothetical protein